MVRAALIVVLLVVVAVLADRVAREENQRDALATGACAVGDDACLATIQTRSAWGWQLYYGLTAALPGVDWTSAPATATKV
ncbi:MAG: hypothetical protein ABI697_13675 [Devosia sp.]